MLIGILIKDEYVEIQNCECLKSHLVTNYIALAVVRNHIFSQTLFSPDRRLVW